MRAEAVDAVAHVGQLGREVDAHARRQPEHQRALQQRDDARERALVEAAADLEHVPAAEQHGDRLAAARRRSRASATRTGSSAALPSPRDAEAQLLLPPVQPLRRRARAAARTPPATCRSASTPRERRAPRSPSTARAPSSSAQHDRGRRLRRHDVVGRTVTYYLVRGEFCAVAWSADQKGTCKRCHRPQCAFIHPIVRGTLTSGGAWSEGPSKLDAAVGTGCNSLLSRRRVLGAFHAHGRQRRAQRGTRGASSGDAHGIGTVPASGRRLDTLTRREDVRVLT